MYLKNTVVKTNSNFYRLKKKSKQYIKIAPLYLLGYQGDESRSIWLVAWKDATVKHLKNLKKINTM